MKRGFLRGWIFALANLTQIYADFCTSQSHAYLRGFLHGWTFARANPCNP
ncbi:MAG: hypothetical protein FWG87_11995 [Defluviitaleaceae bacterium]|nr:hypothetical protein [Defluviitaleaceae bacterium]